MYKNREGEKEKGVKDEKEYIKRVKIKKEDREDEERTNSKGKKVEGVGGGKVAMEDARNAARIGSESYIVYRRREKERPERAEEGKHAKGEGIIFKTLTNLKEILVEENGYVKGMVCIRMELGE
ncbi:NAD-binding protein, partial [Clostridioides difficile]|uniref:NAD-binding protein n=1 Tax=Clostridioides difficile TaxID=1496 RepID=UPI001F4638BA